MNYLAPDMIIKILDVIINNGSANGNFLNIPTPVMDWGIWWNDIQELKGWKVQQNMVTHHVRIIDPNKMRRAWGTQKAMEDLFERIAKANHIK